MQLTIFFSAPGPVAIPVQYGHLLQGLIYRRMDNPVLRSYLHEHGFALEKRRFKLFTFSRLMGQAVTYDQAAGRLVLTPPLRLVICSPIPFILQELGTGFLRQGRVRLGDAHLEVKKMATAAPWVTRETLQVRMLSPLVVYSTLSGVDGRNYTYYYSPFEPRFTELVASNLAKKHFLVYGQPARAEGFAIRPVRVEDRDLKVTYYKDTVIKGWMGEYELSGDLELLQLALDAGLGSKNSQGYGCCNLVEKASQVSSRYRRNSNIM
ncbi:CRISPR-associated endoribonuclease Cas6 [Candidatus Desulforudis audaxviator]|uniref:CRISPR-associated endoribonuclease n=1 Tax=Desulforudis audaxviator (strain MP104C) TaxID=477974 RepID=B1I5K4_DESAP|nr:CRISPR-associated endoribonuclease Cas6 [Candidatus Desulforudis audaxviator]ACA60313.1 CRISPR-associated protein Cas6 [Candidatus Desulforudis audaxviator MP104C]AZK60361.1 CRISPR repeat RNA endoribonuclease Cas6 [Candidatus Desulforudis audaxviator]